MTNFGVINQQWKRTNTKNTKNNLLRNLAISDHKRSRAELENVEPSSSQKGQPEDEGGGGEAKRRLDTQK